MKSQSTFAQKWTNVPMTAQNLQILSTVSACRSNGLLNSRTMTLFMFLSLSFVFNYHILNDFKLCLRLTDVTCPAAYC